MWILVREGRTLVCVLVKAYQFFFFKYQTDMRITESDGKLVLVIGRFGGLVPNIAY